MHRHAVKSLVPLQQPTRMLYMYLLRSHTRYIGRVVPKGGGGGSLGNHHKLGVLYIEINRSERSLQKLQLFFLYPHLNNWATNKVCVWISFSSINLSQASMTEALFWPQSLYTKWKIQNGHESSRRTKWKIQFFSNTSSMWSISVSSSVWLRTRMLRPILAVFAHVCNSHLRNHKMRHSSSGTTQFQSCLAAFAEEKSAVKSLSEACISTHKLSPQCHTYPLILQFCWAVQLSVFICGAWCYITNIR